MTTGFRPSFENTHVADIADNAICLQTECLLSHNLAELDKKNFGKHYEEKSRPTNLFPKICHNCLRAKFGLYESYTENNLLLSCKAVKSINMSSNKTIEGPWLKACLPVKNFINRKSVVFPKNTLIIPSGQPLVEILMSDPEVLYNYDKSVPKIKLNVKDGPPEQNLNPFVYAYFKHLNFIKSHPSHYVKPKSVDSFATTDDYLWCNQIKTKGVPLEATYEVDALMMGNLVTPLSSLSKHVSLTKSSKLDPQKKLNVDAEDNPTDFTVHRERSEDEANPMHTLTILNPHEDLYAIESRKIQLLNKILNDHTLPMKQLIINRKSYLYDLFEYKHDLSALGLHVSSLCVPEAITYVDSDGNHRPFKQYTPNVSWFEGFGLYSLRDICENDLLIIEKTVVTLENFLKMKVNVFEDHFVYNTKHLHTSDEPSSLLLETRKTGLPKECLYKYL